MAMLIVAVAMLPFPTLAQEAPELRITSTNYIAIDAETGEIYAQRGAHERRAPASLTKVFTAIETIESAPPD
ncbi:MAG: D-alanyl-D-alanine carboxypeptidase, partial [Chloroflexota bacterium]|nr:D-alanyl-D-alanine carboxypeptidase [Chloroflexota bacterium]